MEKELEYINSSKFKLGEYLYMGMGTTKNGGNQKVCLSVAYKIDYALKKALQFEVLNNEVTLKSINKVKVGDTEKCKEFIVTKGIREWAA